jgi:DNA-binding NarL/FixJ family response regulator
MTTHQPIFATRRPLRIAGVRQLLAGAGILADPKLVYPEDLEGAVTGAGNWLVILDGESMPHTDILLRLRRSSPGSRIVLWTEHLTQDLLVATLEFGLQGLLSSRLPLEEAAAALRRMCRGERLLRFDSDIDTLHRPAAVEAPSQPVAQQAVAAAPSFDAQWMLDGADSQGRET